MENDFVSKINGLSAKIIADSISPKGHRITTFELEYPRIVHSELMTHRVFSRNAMSSRAIPIAKMIEQVINDPAMPVRFGANQPGMQDKGLEHQEPVWIDWIEIEKEFGETEIQEVYGTAREAWAAAANDAALRAGHFDKAGYHKQIGNRLLEPFQRMKTVLTATEFNNFWWLRVDKDADPTIYALSGLMKKAYDESTPEKLQPGQWHTPYVEHIYTFNDGDEDDVFEGYCVLNDDGIPQILALEEALSISSSCCAQVSYRRLNSTKDKALSIYEKLLSGNKVHASPFEHQATPIIESGEYYKTDSEGERCIHRVNDQRDPDTWENGITHIDRGGEFWSGNLRGWRQHRQLVPNNTVSG